MPQERSHAPLSAGETWSSEVALRLQGTGGQSEHKWPRWQQTQAQDTGFVPKTLSPHLAWAQMPPAWLGLR